MGWKSIRIERKLPSLMVGKRRFFEGMILLVILIYFISYQAIFLSSSSSAVFLMAFFPSDLISSSIDFDLPIKRKNQYLALRKGEELLLNLELNPNCF